ncbi:hypothetical protein SLEP1_g52701 [Rubroshorea leprosula]|uniref:Uncharacterized protein n=1 Tax=Rubroshorea leprosula TaxID=152421 RepID=A0AAV5M738_9ROSI|nr:hypothetical protein SLEP1_g52701 [Rubroshorea leprosula]
MLFVFLTIYLSLHGKEEKYFINNHLSFRIMFHRNHVTDSAQTVRFEVSPNRCCTNFMTAFVQLFSLFLL